MEYCTQCQQNNVCFQCLSTFVINSNNACACPDSSFSIVNNACTCPTLTTLFNSHCYECNVTFCTLCQTNNQCSTCNAPFVVQNGQCVCPASFVLVNGNNCSCPDSTYVIVNSTCVCPSLTSLFQGTCVNCNVGNCNLCQTANVCTTCINNLVPALVNGTSVCQCPDTTFILNQNNQCVCPAGMIQQSTSSGGVTCVACNVQYCSTCPTLTTCSGCNPSFNLVS